MDSDDRALERLASINRRHCSSHLAALLWEVAHRPSTKSPGFLPRGLAGGVCLWLLSRAGDVGKAKATVAAERIMQRVRGVRVTPHFCRIEDKDPSFYREFNIIVLGLDSLEARSYINSIICSFLGKPLPCRWHAARQADSAQAWLRSVHGQ